MVIPMYLLKIPSSETEEVVKGKLTEPKTIQILSKNLFVCF
jgi:hypothetical protein